MRTPCCACYSAAWLSHISAGRRPSRSTSHPSMRQGRSPSSAAAGPCAPPEDGERPHYGGSVTVGSPAGRTEVRSFSLQGGMCPRCEGMGTVSDINLAELFDEKKSL